MQAQDGQPSSLLGPPAPGMGPFAFGALRAARQQQAQVVWAARLPGDGLFDPGLFSRGLLRTVGFSFLFYSLPAEYIFLRF